MQKITMYLLIAFGVIVLLWFLYSWLSVRSIEEPRFSIQKTTNDYEIRTYEPYIIAETVVTGAQNRDIAANKGFPIIAGYIFGNNTKQDSIAMTVPVNTTEEVSQQIAMTVPVNTQPGESVGDYTISFVMPRQYTLDTLPKPNDSKVALRQIPARTVAVKTFSWSNSEATFKKQESILRAALQRDGIDTVGSVNVARYNPPWTIPFMLRNEIQIEVK